jgi:uncharacterized protein YbcI
MQREIVILHKETFGRGPVRSKLYLHEDAVIVLMFEGHTTSEGTMARMGDQRGVAHSRVDLSESVRERFIAVVERHTGRRVIGFMSSSQQNPDLLSHVYALRPTDLVPHEGEAPPPTD